MLDFNLVKRVLPPAGGEVSKPGTGKVDQPSREGAGEPQGAVSPGGEED